ncbi:MAG: caspase family protein, partial [Pseudomonadota bacterium]
QCLMGLIVAGAALTLGFNDAAAQERRLALVMANQDYPANVGRLSNTHGDAATVEAALIDVGFDVTKVLDANEDEMERALLDFETAINAAATEGGDVVAFVYASMHGAAADVGGQTRNFLLPAREDITSSSELRLRGIRVDEMLNALRASEAKAVLVISDACRNDLGQSFNKSATKGFVPEPTGPGMLVAYATSPGATTPDDGLFAQTLADEITTAGREATISVLKAVQRVGGQRKFEGQPYFTGSLPEWLCFNGCVPVKPPSQPRSDDENDWLRLSEINIIQTYEAYLALHPDGAYIEEAQAAIANLQAGNEVVPAPRNVEAAPGIAAPFTALSGLVVRHGDIIDAVTPVYAEVDETGTLGNPIEGNRYGGTGGGVTRLEKDGHLITEVQLTRGRYFGASHVIYLDVTFQKLGPNGLMDETSQSERLGSGNYATNLIAPYVYTAPRGYYISALSAPPSLRHSSGEVYLTDLVAEFSPIPGFE